MANQPKAIENDALVVLCLRDMEDKMTHHHFRLRAQSKGFELSKSDCHNMLHRAMGRVRPNSNNEWHLTAMGQAYRDDVVDTLCRLVGIERPLIAVDIEIKND
jgi:hypothetical protein